MRGPNKGDSIVKFRSLHRSLVGVALASVASLILASCGGGGAGGNPDTATADVTISPATATIYAGVPFTFTIQGGKTPYSLSTSEPGLLPLPAQTSSHSWTVIPNQPGVIDVGLQTGELPVRSAIVTVRSADGTPSAGRSATWKVAQNFLLGYGLRFSATGCHTTGTAVAANTACAGGETLVELAAVTNGVLFAGRQYRFEVLRGQYQFVFPQTGVVGNTLTTTTDSTGIAHVVIQVAAGTPTQIAVMRVTDVATGLYADQAFVISGVGANGKLTPLPDSFTFTGNLTTECGTGSGDFLVFDGVPPFTAISSNPLINVDSSSTSSPGRFTIRLSGSTPPCQTGTIVVTDAVGNRATVDVASVLGTVTPPPPPLQVSPNSITLECGSSGSVSVVGGSGKYSASSPTAFISTTIATNTLTVSRLSGTTATNPVIISVTDGATIVPLSVTTTLLGVATTTCP